MCMICIYHLHKLWLLLCKYCLWTKEASHYVSQEIYHNPLEFYEYYLVYYMPIVWWIYMPPIVPNLLYSVLLLHLIVICTHALPLHRANTGHGWLVCFSGVNFAKPCRVMTKIIDQISLEPLFGLLLMVVDLYMYLSIVLCRLDLTVANVGWWMIAISTWAPITFLFITIPSIGYE